MKGKIVLTSEAIVNKRFAADMKGYHALEVDQFLDVVAEDYEKYDSLLKDYQEKMDALTQKNETLRQQITDLQAKLAVVNTRVKNIGDDEEVSRSNIDLLNRIKVLEIALYKAGIDPTKIK